jgi:serine/threonine-protein kinase ATR
MAAMQSLLHVPEFTGVTLKTWHVFMTQLSFRDIGPYIGSTSAAFVKGWLNFDDSCREIASRILHYLIVDNFEDIREFITDIVSLEGIPELGKPKRRLDKLLGEVSDTTRMDMLLQRCCSDNVTVASLSLLELKHFLGYKASIVQKWATGDVFDTTIGAIVHVLLSAASRDGDAFKDIRLTAYECFGLLGALDPDRFEPRSEETTMIVLHNFMDEGEAVGFALHLIRNLLVGAFRSTSDLRYQSHLAYAIQELLKFCQFTADLVKSAGGNSVPMKVRNRWESLPKHMLDTIAPLLEGKFSHDAASTAQYQHPIYDAAMSYRDWVQQWASFLVSRASGEQARTIFGSFRLAVRSQDAEVARYLIPHLVLNTLISGTEDDSESIRTEIVTILQAQIEGRNDDRRLLAAQVSWGCKSTHAIN